MKKNNMVKNKKTFIIVSCVLCGAIIVALVLLASLLNNSEAANVLSIIASILSVVLSIVAIIYTFYSTIQTDAKLKEILEMGKKMQKIEHEIKTVREEPDNHTQELQDRIKQYEKDLEYINQLFE